MHIWIFVSMGCCDAAAGFSSILSCPRLYFLFFGLNISLMRMVLYKNDKVQLIQRVSFEFFFFPNHLYFSMKQECTTYIIMNNEFNKKYFNLSFWFARIQKVCFLLRFLKKPLYNFFNNSRFSAFHYINFNLKLTRSTHQVTSQSHENKERSKIKILVAFLLVLFVLLFFFSMIGRFVLTIYLETFFETCFTFVISLTTSL